MIKYLLVTFLLLSLSACAPKSQVRGMLGFSDNRRIVIVGEHVDKSIAAFYQHKYEAMVWFTPSKGMMGNAAAGFLNGIGPSHPMQVLIAELKSINYTIGRWEIIVPKIAESYFLATLKNMENSSIAKARGMVVLIDSKGNKEIEEQVNRVGNGNFFVVYEFQKY